MDEDTEARIDLEHYTDADRAEHDRSLLEDEDLHPTLREEADDENQEGKILVLEVPESEADRAYEILQEYWETEDEDTLEIFDDWEEESEDARESFEQT